MFHLKSCWYLLTLSIIVIYLAAAETSFHSGKLPIEKVNYCEDRGRRANAVIVALVRNSDLTGIASTITQLERRFNKNFHYPYVFLNDVAFDEEFKQHVFKLTSSSTQFGLVPEEHWNQPEWIDETKASAARNRMVDQKLAYGGSVSYRNMCRFYSGFFFRHELLLPYKYYWRIEPDVEYHCDLDYDPFLLLQDEGKVYGFTISLYEYQDTIPSLWKTVKAFTEEHPDLVHSRNALSFLSDDGGNSYNGCHFWSNFEIADLDFWRSETYSKFFEYLDQAGGFYYERWGDAPVHSIAVALFASREQTHFFDEIGYRHPPFQHCPQGKLHGNNHCRCDITQNFDYEGYSCLWRFDALSSR